METMKKTYLLGVKNNQIITADITITERNGYPEFTASFNEGDAFNIDTIDDDYKKDYKMEYWDCLDDKTKLNLLEDGDITKEEALENLDNEYYNDYHDYIDCSCTDYEIDHNGITINFQSSCGGQHDVREDNDFDNMILTSKKLFDDIMYLWDNYHLKDITSNKEVEKRINDIIEIGKNFEEYEDGFNKFIIDNIDWEVLR